MPTHFSMCTTITRLRLSNSAAIVAVAAVLFMAATVARAQGAGQSTESSNKLQFPESTATASEVCGACHKAIYREFVEGAGTDLNWSAMKFNPQSTKLLNVPSAMSKTGTAHPNAGTDPWPIEAKRVEADGRECNVCHFPQALVYPDVAATKIERPIPRAANRELGVTCASCHLTPDGKVRGSYAVDAPHETIVDERLQTSAACAYCHSDGERVVGKQTQTFLEWREDFSKAGLGKQQCQDCHMPKTVRKLAEDFPTPERVVARHSWTGGHSFQRIASALHLAIRPSGDGRARMAFHVTNIGAGHSVPTGSNRRAIYLTAEAVASNGKVVASTEWMFAPWMLARPDDKKFVAEDLKGKDPIATSQADAQGPHETIIRAGEERVLEWMPALPRGQYTVRATLTYDLNRYNDRAFKGDQFEIARTTAAIRVTGLEETTVSSQTSSLMRQ